jgi:hypothetical protein
VIQKFDSIDDFIMTTFPDIESYLKEALSSNIHRLDLDTIEYSELAEIKDVHCSELFG